MDFDFSDDQIQLGDAVRKWVERGYGFERRRSIERAGGFDRTAWDELAELGLTVDNASIAAHYRGVIDGMVVHGDDPAPGDIAIARTDTLMPEAADRARVAQAALMLARGLR